MLIIEPIIDSPNSLAASLAASTFDVQTSNALAFFEEFLSDSSKVALYLSSNSVKYPKLKDWLLSYLTPASFN